MEIMNAKETTIMVVMDVYSACDSQRRYETDQMFSLSELTAQPVILNVEDIDVAGQNGCRLLVIRWKVSDRN